MAEMVRFVVDVPKQDLMDLALNLEGDEVDSTVPPGQLAKYLKDAIIAGFEEYLGEEVSVQVYPSKTPAAAPQP